MATAAGIIGLAGAGLIARNVFHRDAAAALLFAGTSAALLVGLVSLFAIGRSKARRWEAEHPPSKEERAARRRNFFIGVGILALTLVSTLLLAAHFPDRPDVLSVAFFMAVFVGVFMIQSASPEMRRARFQFHEKRQRAQPASVPGGERRSNQEFFAITVASAGLILAVVIGDSARQHAELHLLLHVSQFVASALILVIMIYSLISARSAHLRVRLDKPENAWALLKIQRLRELGAAFIIPGGVALLFVAPMFDEKARAWPLSLSAAALLIGFCFLGAAQIEKLRIDQGSKKY